MILGTLARAAIGAMVCTVCTTPVAYTIDAATLVLQTDEEMQQQAQEEAEQEAEQAEQEAQQEAEEEAEQQQQAQPQQPQQAQETLTPATIQVGSSCLSYVDSFEATAAPHTGAGLWMGSDSTTDGSWGYFIGHNPGPFHEVMGLGEGDTVVVCDRNGHQLTYSVATAFQVTDDTCWEDIAGQVTGYGESVVLQTCCGDNAHYRIVVCTSSFPDE